ncbi:MAG: 30S ribosome-binding factor RbfA [Coriobacteriales bacterium]|jgi:ribosome-binding factor A|nr:30S ribosome-binding factor RbfA [Coriobacteriales bacterium]
MKQTANTRKSSETLREALAQIILLHMSDPRLQGLTITEAQVSPDKRTADIYVTAAEQEYDDLKAGLNSAKGRLRSMLGRTLEWRVVPELRFHIDTGIDHAQLIDEKLREGRAA